MDDQVVVIVIPAPGVLETYTWNNCDLLPAKLGYSSRGTNVVVSPSSERVRVIRGTQIVMGLSASASVTPYAFTTVMQPSFTGTSYVRAVW